MGKLLIVAVEAGLLLLFAAGAMTALVAPSAASPVWEAAALTGLLLLAATRSGLHRRLVPARFARAVSASR